MRNFLQQPLDQNINKTINKKITNLCYTFIPLINSQKKITHKPSPQYMHYQKNGNQQQPDDGENQCRLQFIQQAKPLHLNSNSHRMNHKYPVTTTEHPNRLSNQITNKDSYHDHHWTSASELIGLKCILLFKTD